MLYILHGDDTVSQRNRLTDLIQEQGKAVFLNGDKANSDDILKALQSTDLFLESKFIVIEKAIKLSRETLEKILPDINRASSSGSLHIVLCHDSELSKLFLGKFKQAKVEMFVFPKLFFTFLDRFTPHSLKNELDLLSKMENVEAEQIFYALIKRLRQLVLLKNASDSLELAKMGPWQKDKLRAQSSKFKIEELEHILKQLFKIEVKMKSGGLTLPLRKQLDILVIAELN